MKQMIYRYIREGIVESDGSFNKYKGKRIGVICAIGKNKIGWSKLDERDVKQSSPIERKAAIGLAVARAVMPELPEIMSACPHNIRVEVEHFRELSNRYFMME